MLSRFGNSLARSVARPAGTARAFHSTPSASRIIGSQPLRAKEAPAPLNAAKGYPIIDHE